jgi:Na+/H+ antiporter NhaA
MAVARPRDAETAPTRASFREHTLWPRGLAAPVRDFLSDETAGAVVLLGAALAAVIWANSPWPQSYEAVWTTTFSLRIGDMAIAQDLRHWVNDGLMTLYFLVLGLEAKRELAMGQLRDRRRAAVPLAAALGGMALPAAIYLAFNATGPGRDGWGAAISTDTAFALGALALVAPASTRVRVRLLTLAVFDDLIALVVIAVAYNNDVSAGPLVVGIGLLAALGAVRKLPRAWRPRATLILGVALWVSLYEAHVDPVVTGLAIGLVTSVFAPRRTELAGVVELVRSFREQPTPERARTAQRGMSSAISINDRLGHRLHPWTSFVVVPLFALANAGIHIDGNLLSRGARSPITLGILFAYVVGKPIGITVAGTVGLRLRLGPRVLSQPAIVGVGVIAGIGFTVALLISSLAFTGRALEEAKLGILSTPVIASVGGWVAFRLLARLPTSIRARQVARTVDDIVDLADDVDPARDHVRGATDAPVTLVEYGDYECRYCGQAEVVVRQLLQEFGDDLRYVWRHLPLAEVHPHAQLAAEAAEAAAGQGAFWAMHDTLLTHQGELRPGDLRRYAVELGLDADRLSDELGRHVYRERVAEDVAGADASGVAGTPSFFVNGGRHDGAYDIATLSAAVRAAGARAVARDRLGTGLGCPGSEQT